MYLTGMRVDEASDIGLFPLNARGLDVDGNEYIYVQASGAVAQYNAVNIDPDGQAANLTKALHDSGFADLVGAPQVGLTDNQYGWALIWGAGRVIVGANCSANDDLYTTGTAGRLDDTSSSQTEVVRIMLTSGRGSGVGDAPCLMRYPGLK